MRLAILMIMAIVAVDSFGQSAENKIDSSTAKVQPPPVNKIETDTLSHLKLTPLQIQDVQSYQIRVKEFQIRIELESNALQREYRAMMHAIIHANNIAEYTDWYLESDKLNVIVPKKNKP